MHGRNKNKHFEIFLQCRQGTYNWEVTTKVVVDME